MTVHTIAITREQLDAWAGRSLTDDEIERLDEALPNSSVPEAIGTIVASFDDEEVDDGPDGSDITEVTISWTTTLVERYVQTFSIDEIIGYFDYEHDEAEIRRLVARNDLGYALDLDSFLAEEEDEPDQTDTTDRDVDDITVYI